jgi:hypothetical protein
VLTILKSLQILLGLLFAFYVFRGLMGKMSDRDWTRGFIVMMALFTIAYIKHRLTFAT